jgi:hypothetical protein
MASHHHVLKFNTITRDPDFLHSPSSRWSQEFNSKAVLPERMCLLDMQLLLESLILTESKEALSYIQGWPSDIQECIQNTPLQCFNRSNLRDRWSIPLVTPQQAANGVTLAGVP